MHRFYVHMHVSCKWIQKQPWNIIWISILQFAKKQFSQTVVLSLRMTILHSESTSALKQSVRWHLICEAHIRNSQRIKNVVFVIQDSIKRTFSEGVVLMFFKWRNALRWSWGFTWKCFTCVEKLDAVCVYKDQFIHLTLAIFSNNSKEFI